MGMRDSRVLGVWPCALLVKSCTFQAHSILKKSVNISRTSFVLDIGFCEYTLDVQHHFVASKAVPFLHFHLFSNVIAVVTYVAREIEGIDKASAITCVRATSKD